jgi:D-glycerate 3-kinase
MLAGCVAGDGPARYDGPMTEIDTGHIVDALCAAREGRARLPFVVGIAGSQGSGKSTLAREIEVELLSRGFRVATLSIDDLYLQRVERERLARDVHPLLEVRGVPGTHDVALGHAVIDACGRPGNVSLPRFAKERDDRLPAEQWARVEGPLDMLLFEGWCVGAAPQDDAQLDEPVNALERQRDADGVWRRWVNQRLAQDYAGLFARIDWQIFLAAPSFDVVAGWRREQEEALRHRLSEAGESAEGTMDDAGIDRFVQYYQRITEHMLADVPGRADLIIQLDRQRRRQVRLSH